MFNTKKILSFAMLVLFIFSSIFLFGCGSYNEVEVAEKPDGIRQEMWDKSFEFYQRMEEAVANGLHVSDELSDEMGAYYSENKVSNGVEGYIALLVMDMLNHRLEYKLADWNKDESEKWLAHEKYKILADEARLVFYK